MPATGGCGIDLSKQCCLPEAKMPQTGWLSGGFLRILILGCDMYEISLDGHGEKAGI